MRSRLAGLASSIKVSRKALPCSLIKPSLSERAASKSWISVDELVGSDQEGHAGSRGLEGSH